MIPFTSTAGIRTGKLGHSSTPGECEGSYDPKFLYMRRSEIISHFLKFNQSDLQYKVINKNINTNSYCTLWCFCCRVLLSNLDKQWSTERRRRTFGTRKLCALTAYWLCQELYRKHHPEQGQGSYDLEVFPSKKQWCSLDPSSWQSIVKITMMFLRQSHTFQSDREL